MTIDPTKFEAQGRPTKDQAKQVWLNNRQPSMRKLEAILKGMGYDISYRTLTRWLVDGVGPGSRALAHATKVRGVKKEIAAALLEIPADTLTGADEMRENGITPTLHADLGKTAGARAQDAVQAEVDVIDRRIIELLVKSESELDIIEQKSRKILNIVLNEAAARRANVMVLIPKDTAAFVDAMTEASKQTLTGGLDQPPKAGDPKTIDGNAIDVTPPTELASTISKFLQDEGMAG